MTHYYTDNTAEARTSSSMHTREFIREVEEGNGSARKANKH